MTRERNDERRKDEIREAAIRCFVRQGLQKTRLADIAREAELSKGGVYFHYRTKEALFDDILDVVLRRLQSRWSFQPVSDQPADRTLHRLVVAHLRTLEDEADETRLGHLLVALTPQNPAFRDKLGEAFELMRSLYGGVIARGVGEGVFVDRPPEVLANCVLAMVQGLAYQAATDPQGRLPVRPEDAAEIALAMVVVPGARKSVRPRARSAALRS